MRKREHNPLLWCFLIAGNLQSHGTFSFSYSYLLELQGKSKRFLLVVEAIALLMGPSPQYDPPKELPQFALGRLEKEEDPNMTFNNKWNYLGESF
jgi:hypothetical protein